MKRPENIKDGAMKELDAGTVFYFAYYPDDTVVVYDSDMGREIAINSYLKKMEEYGSEYEVRTQEFYLSELYFEDKQFERAALKEIGINLEEN